MTAFTRHLATLTMTIATSALLATAALAPAAVPQDKAPVAQTGPLVA